MAFGNSNFHTGDFKTKGGGNYQFWDDILSEVNQGGDNQTIKSDGIGKWIIEHSDSNGEFDHYSLYWELGKNNYTDGGWSTLAVDVFLEVTLLGDYIKDNVSGNSIWGDN